MENKIFDIVIVGAGPAGMTSAIYAARAGKSVCILDKDGFGGNISKSPVVENIPGYTSISGVDFSINMYNQMTSYETVEHVISEIKLIRYDHGMYRLYTDDNSIICAMSLIVATGSKHKELNLDTKNIYYCVTCDGPLFKKKDVIVVGSGNSGTTYALELANYCRTVYLCDITSTPCCEEALKAKVQKAANLKWIPNATIKEVKNNKDGNLTQVILSNGDTIKCSGIFSAIGLTPQTDILENIANLDTYGYVVADSCEAKTLPGLFVAGDCRQKDVRQVTTACGDGTIAAIKAVKFIDNIKNIV